MVGPFDSSRCREAHGGQAKSRTRSHMEGPWKPVARRKEEVALVVLIGRGCRGCHRVVVLEATGIKGWCNGGGTVEHRPYSRCFMPQGTLYHNLLTTTRARSRTAFEVLPHNDLIQTEAWLL